jgi:heme/copper-type cytochrome/quinol oxidase subunit 2
MVVLMKSRLTAYGLWLTALAVGSSSSIEPQAPGQIPAKPVIVTIEAERFAFSPSEVKVNAGETIEFRLKSSDTDHGFRILDTDINVTIPKRGKGTATVTFTPKKPGRYTFECSRVCGAGHSFMRGTLVVK